MLEDIIPTENGPTLIVDFNDHPEWCREEKSLFEYKNVKLGSMVHDLNNTLCKVIHISSDGFMRLELMEYNFRNGISTKIKEGPSTSSSYENLKKIL